MAAANYPKVAQFPTPEAFREYLKNERLEIGLVDKVPSGNASFLSKPAEGYGKKGGTK